MNGVTQFKICPKCSFPSDSKTECTKCGVQFADIRSAKGDHERIDRQCPWNDHGHICNRTGSISDTTNGTGPWYCSEHYWQLKGRPIKPEQAAQPSYRQRWFDERKLPYQAAKQPDEGLRKALKGWTALYGKEPRMREPGED